MNAIICLNQTANSNCLNKMFWTADTVVTSRLGEETVEIHSFNPRYRKRFPKLISKIRQHCTRIYFTEAMEQYPEIYHFVSAGDCFFRHLPHILSQMAYRDVRDVGILCEKEDPRLIPLVEILSRFSPSVSILTENDAFFERISQILLASHGMSLNQKNRNTMGKKQVLFLLNTTLTDCSAMGEFLIDFNDTKPLFHSNQLWDITTGEISAFFQTFHITDIKHCYFVPKQARELKLIWKISKKS
ncbi:MAG: hypothetical protein J6A61_07830 [Clostridia bacterium]|nr:hypothetical protein [Clostridia bacterium]